MKSSRLALKIHRQTDRQTVRGGQSQIGKAGTTKDSQSTAEAHLRDEKSVQQHTMPEMSKSWDAMTKYSSASTASSSNLCPEQGSTLVRTMRILVMYDRYKSH